MDCEEYTNASLEREIKTNTSSEHELNSNAPEECESNVNVTQEREINSNAPDEHDINSNAPRERDINSHAPDERDTNPNVSESEYGTSSNASLYSAETVRWQHNTEDMLVDNTVSSSDQINKIEETYDRVNMENRIANVNKNGTNNETPNSPREETNDNDYEVYINTFFETLETNDIEEISNDLATEFCATDDNFELDNDIFMILNNFDEGLDFNRESLYVYDETEINDTYQIFTINESPNSSLQARPDKVKMLVNLEKYDSDIQGRIENICTKYSDIFQLPDEKLNMTNMAEHKIIVIDNIPINVKQYRYPPMLKDEIERQIKKMLDEGIIEHSDSPYNNPLLRL